MRRTTEPEVVTERKMLAIHHSRQRWASGLLSLAVLAGCSSTRSGSLTADNYAPKPPDLKSVSVPGTADVARGDEMRHPATVHVAYARWQEQQKQLPQARQSYQLALNHDPRSVEALLGLSRLDRLAGRYSEAELHLQRAEKLRPHDPLVAAAWGEHYAAQGRWPDAIRRYEAAIERAPEEAIYKHQLAVALMKVGDIPGSLAVFAKLVGPAEAHYNVGYLLQQQGKLLEAEEQFQRAIAMKPELQPAQTMLAKVRKERGVPSQVELAGASTQGTSANSTAAAATASAGEELQSAGWQTPAQGQASSPAIPRDDLPRPPAGLTPQQLEQWRNQQALQYRP